MIFGIGRGFAEVQILKTVKFNSLSQLEYFDKILQTHWYWQDLAQGIAKWHLSSVEAFAERQILNKWKWPYLLNWVEYFNKLLRKHWYWQDVTQEIAKWHFSLGEALPSSKFWKKW